MSKRNNKKYNKISKIIILILFLNIIFISSCSHQKRLVCNENNCFEVEIAKTTQEKSKGLMYREELDENKGMLFLFMKEEYHYFWMKNTLIPLDMIWIDSDKKITYIYENAQPCKTEYCENIIPKGKALYVLEVNAGEVERLGWKIEDQLVFKNIALIE